MARAEMSTLDQVELAAHAGMPDALFRLGLMYANGRDVAQDLITAHKWFNLAAVRGNASAREYRAEIAREMTNDQISEAQKSAREWLSIH